MKAARALGTEQGASIVRCCSIASFDIYWDVWCALTGPSGTEIEIPVHRLRLAS